MDSFSASMAIAGSGLQTQSARMRIVSENLANAQSTGTAPGADAFRRKLISIEAVEGESGGYSLAGVARISRDPSAFRIEHDPGHPAADARGQVKYPNVSMLVELADMRDAGRAYEANLQIVKQTRQLVSMTLDMLRDR
jgi:flagellar basal-body rod protein FlgC